MRVRATQKGFFGGVLRDPGTLTEEFVLDEPEAQFAAEWMVALEANAPAPEPEPAPAPEPEPAPAPEPEPAPVKPAAAPKPEAEKL